LLQDEISKLSSNIKVLVISCLSGIVGKIGGTSEAKTGIEHAMSLISAAFYDISHQRKGLLRIIVAPCVPRKSKDYATHSAFALVVFD
jgi:hypothetical protein